MLGNDCFARVLLMRTNGLDPEGTPETLVHGFSRGIQKRSVPRASLE
jgi:hypothetical protein